MESGEELFLKFHNLNQWSGEQPTAFLMRLQSHLRRLIRKGGADEARSDHLLLSQFIRGLLFDSMLVVDLNLRERLTYPPRYLTLLGMVRRQEEENSTRERKARIAKSTKHNAHSSQAQIEDALLDRVARLELHMTPSHSQPPTNMPPYNQTPSHSQHQANMPPYNQTPSHSQHQTSMPPYNHTPSFSQQPSHMPPREGRRNPTRQIRCYGCGESGHMRNGCPHQNYPTFCFRCGEDGHTKRGCTKPENHEAVNKKFIQIHLQQGNESRRQMRSGQASSKDD